MARFLLRSVKGRENILIVGKENQKIRAEIRKLPHIQAYYHPYENDDDSGKIKSIVHDKSITQIYLVHNNWPDNRLMNFYDWCENVHVDLKFVPGIVQLCKGEVAIDSSLGVPVFHLRSVSLSGFNFYFKRIMDLIIAISILSFIWPMLLMVAILIKIDSPGSFLYRHKRMGYRGRIFDFFKFRTMVINADELLAKYREMSERKGPVFKMAKDPRITLIGRTLRRYSVDELLQLLNVLRGEMSLVGPRPQVLWEASAYDDWAKRRLRVLPGITGLWQVSGRASLSYEEMIELDIYYIESWSPGLDIKILFNTLPAIFSQEGAY
jgi:exopolysaccharide biosynthesis polyprenyl glycosylphosphotransferase